MRIDYKSRWKTGEGASAFASITRDIQAGKFDRTSTPFGIFGDRCDFRGFPISSLNGMGNCQFEQVDFSYADFSAVRIQKCQFNNVNFQGSHFLKSADFQNRLDQCIFESATFGGATLGLGGSTYNRCVFRKCNFQNASFTRPEINNCRFDHNQLSGVDFNATSFEDTEFIGVLSDVWFRGEFAYASETEAFGRPRQNSMLRVSFAKAVLHWVTFSNCCDLSTVILPEDGRHRLYDRWKMRLESAVHATIKMSTEDRATVLGYLRTFTAHADTQEWYILNADETIEELGETKGSQVLAALDHA